MDKAYIASLSVIIESINTIIKSEKMVAHIHEFSANRGMNVDEIYDDFVKKIINQTDFKVIEKLKGLKVYAGQRVPESLFINCDMIAKDIVSLSSSGSSHSYSTALLMIAYLINAFKLIESYTGMISYLTTGTALNERLSGWGLDKKTTESFVAFYKNYIVNNAEINFPLLDKNLVKQLEDSVEDQDVLDFMFSNIEFIQRDDVLDVIDSASDEDRLLNTLDLITNKVENRSLSISGKSDVVTMAESLFTRHNAQKFYVNPETCDMELLAKAIVTDTITPELKALADKKNVKESTDEF